MINIYSRPVKPSSVHVTRRPRVNDIDFDDVPKPVIVSRETECHVTPSEVAKRMVQYAELVPANMVLEPSAGTGNLVQAMINEHVLCANDDPNDSQRYIVTVEKHHQLHEIIKKTFEMSTNFHMDFLDVPFTAGSFPRIIMNPPFRQVKKHMDKAIKLLGRAVDDDVARLIALVPVSYEHDDAVTLEILGNDTFVTAKVHTKIIMIEV